MICKPPNSDTTVLQRAYSKYEEIFADECRKTFESKMKYPIAETQRRIADVASKLRSDADQVMLP